VREPAAGCRVRRTDTPDSHLDATADFDADDGSDFQ
jgi:hypothetical protein